MLERLRLFRNIGQFDSVATSIVLARFVAIQAENGRGKTTLAAVLRSLASGDPLPIIERRRLTAAHPPHVVLECAGGPPALFQNGAWSRKVPEIAVFDDAFIDDNIYSGLSVSSDHRQNLHDLIIGADGVALNRRLQELVAEIEESNRNLRAKADAIPPAAHGGMTVDTFCALPVQADVDEAIKAAERALAAANDQESVRTTGLLDPLTLTALELDTIIALLQRDLPALDASAAAKVHAHLTGLGPGGEAWVAEGMRRVTSVDTAVKSCPFCAQDLRHSSLIDHYRVYFSAEYSDLKAAVSQAVAGVERQHGGEAVAAFERAVRLLGEKATFWSNFAAAPAITIDTAEIAQSWRAAREAVIGVLRVKEGAPLERLSLPSTVTDAVARFNSHAKAIDALNKSLSEANDRLRLVKESAAASNKLVLASDLSHLKAIKARHASDVAEACAQYLSAKEAKAQLEQERAQARKQLDCHRETVFPAYQQAINTHLQRFNAGFRLDQVVSTNTRGGGSCTYSIVINNQPIAIGGGQPAAGTPSFRNTLSAGDRNALALAFFFASLERDPALSRKVIVIDDPITSLDEHRSLATVQQMRRLVDRSAQVIVLSHRKPFLCGLWEGADATGRTALELVRDGLGSVIREWDVRQDCITEHDRRDALMREYLVGRTSDSRDVARSIRPHLEAFLRVAFPEHFPPGTLLGPFRHLCQQRLGTAHQILDRDDARELAELVEYSNSFHHDTNPAWQTAQINDAELVGYVGRALALATR